METQGFIYLYNEEVHMGSESKSFTDAHSFFQQDDVLSKDWTPERLPERVDELNTIHSCLEPAIRGQTPQNLFIYGKTGQGKTAAVEVKLGELEAFAADQASLDITTVTVSCNDLKRSYHVATHLLAELDGPGASPPRGYDERTLFKMIYDRLNEIGGTIIVILDEIDGVTDDDTIFYEFPRAKANGYLNNEVKLSLIGISNDFDFRRSLSPKVKDSLYDEEMLFEPYDAPQLCAILRRRAARALQHTEYDPERFTQTDGTKGFHSEVLSTDVIPLCAAFAAQENGSARLAIKYLQKACKTADTRDEETVLEQHVREADAILEQEFVERGIATLTTHDHLALLAVAALEATGATPVGTGKVHAKYTTIADRVAVDPLVERRMRDRLDDLDLHGVIAIEERATGKRGGTYWTYKLATSLDQTLRVFEHNERFAEVVQDIRHIGEAHGKL